MKVLFFLLLTILLFNAGGFVFAEKGKISVSSSEGGYVGLEYKIPFGKAYDYDDILVTYVIDGDTVKLENGRIVRLIGIDCPENKYNSAEGSYISGTKNTERTSASFEKAQQAREFTRKLVEGKKVRLEFDEQREDKDGRLLAYVYIEYVGGKEIGDKQQGKHKILFVNANLVEAGYAKPMAIPPNLKHAEIVEKLYQEAKDNKRGLWAL